MKKRKFLISLLLAVAIVSSISVGAFAATPPDYVVSEFRNFQYAEQGYTGSYVRILQRFLLHYNWTTGNYISQNGGVDGSFGTGTYYATYEFQKAVFNDAKQWDGKVGSNTWEKICVNMDFVNVPSEGIVYRFYIGSNLIVSKVGTIWKVVGGDGYTYSIYT